MSLEKVTPMCPVYRDDDEGRERHDTLLEQPRRFEAADLQPDVTSTTRQGRGRARIVREPNPPAPSLVCPRCETNVRFKESIYGGVKPEERWDRYECNACGSFEYRHRTRRLRPAI